MGAFLRRTDEEKETLAFLESRSAKEPDLPVGRVGENTRNEVGKMAVHVNLET